MSDFQTKYQDWQNKAEKAASRFPERREEFQTSSEDMPVKRLYTPEDVDGDYMDKLGFPGEYPYTRGVQPTMYRSRFWTMRQYSGFGSAEETNLRFKYLLEHGQT